MNQLAPSKSGHLRDHACQKGITCNIKWHSQTHVAATLIQNATQTIVITHIELSQKMTRRKRHLLQLRRIPRRHYQSTTGWIFLNLIDDPLQLVNSLSTIISLFCCIWRIPMSPLKSIHWPQIALLPVYTDALKVLFWTVTVPNSNVFILQQFGVCMASHKPYQFLCNTSPKHFLMRQKRKTIFKVVPHHSSKNWLGPCSCSVCLFLSIFYYVLDHPQVLIFFMFRDAKMVFQRIVDIFWWVSENSVVVTQVIFSQCFGNVFAVKFVLR